MFRKRLAIAAIVATGAAIGVVVPGSAQTAPADPQVLEAHLLRTYGAPDANQGVAVDRSNFYYAAHSNYDASPMESSIEVFDTKSMRHIRSHSFGVDRAR